MKDCLEVNVGIPTAPEVTGAQYKLALQPKMLFEPNGDAVFFHAGRDVVRDFLDLGCGVAHGDESACALREGDVVP